MPAWRETETGTETESYRERLEQDLHSSQRCLEDKVSKPGSPSSHPESDQEAGQSRWRNSGLVISFAFGFVSPYKSLRAYRMVKYVSEDLWGHPGRVDCRRDRRDDDVPAR